MKRNTMRMLSVLLTLVMLLGAVPFAAAAETVSATIVANPSGAVWAGTTVDLELVPTTGYTISNVSWTTPNGMESGTSIPVVAATGVYTANYTVNYNNTVSAGAASYNMSVKQPAGDSFAITGANNAVTDQTVTLDTTGENDSAVAWEVNDTVNADITNAGVFSASKAGTYTVTAKAEGNPADVMDNKEATHTIVVTEATYSVTLNKATLALNASAPKMTYTIKKGTENYTGAVTSKHFGSSNTTVATVNPTTGELVLKKAGTSTITLTVVIDGQSYSSSALLTVTDSGVITLEQDGGSYDDDTLELEFDIPGIDKSEDVDWTFEVTGLDKLDFVFSKNNKDEYEVEDDKSIDIDLKAVDGYGVARIDVWADWGNGADEQAEGTFYVAIYDELDIKVTLADDVDDFDFDDDEVFSAVTVGTQKYTDVNAKNATLAELLDDDTASHVDFDEGRNANDNEDVGTIEYTKSSSSSYDYDPDEVNTYKISDLKYLNFEVEDEGNYDIDYMQYQTISGYDKAFITGEGMLRIIVGEGGETGDGDIEYTVDAKGEVTFDEDDFNDFWEDYCDDEDIDEDLDYVKFTGFKASSIYGALYTNNGKKAMTSSLKFFHKYDDDEDSGYDLDDITYEAHSTKSDYVDEIEFTCYGEDGEEVDGVITVTVGKGKDEVTNVVMNFTDVRTSDWYYDSVAYVYSNGIMAGTTTTTFAPNTKLSRAMVATVLYRMAGSPTVTGISPFSDVKDTTSWYYKAVIWAQSKGIVTGTSATTFAPNNNITRQDLALMLYRFAKYQGKSTTATGSLTSFSDSAMVGSWASDALRWAVGQGIVTGSAGKLNPTGTASRAEAAAMLQRYATSTGYTGSSSNSGYTGVVYVTATGTKYHYDKDCAGTYATATTLASAQRSYSPCGTCVD